MNQHVTGKSRLSQYLRIKKNNKQMLEEVMRISNGVAAIAVAAILGSPNLASGEEKKGFDIGSFSANVGLFSDYTYRGVSQTGQEPALQGGIDWAHDVGLYAGFWA
jgi:uncharacterized protein (TIGR02001 family)